MRSFSKIGGFAVLSVCLLLATHAPARADDSAMNVLLGALNAKRTAAGLRPLVLDPSLCDVASEHASDMVRRNYFSHVTPEGLSPFERMTARHIQYEWAGENQAEDRSPQSIAVDFWQSPEHRENLLGEHYVRVGIAWASAPGGLIVVEDFSD